MGPLTTGVVVSLVVFAASVIGLNIHKVIPESHISKETQDVIRLGTGMLSVLASLVLGLMVATANTAFDASSNAVSGYAADLTLLDKTLSDYGENALAARRDLRDYTTKLLNNVWAGQHAHPYLVEDREAGSIMEHVRDAVRLLKPANRDEQWLDADALQISTKLLRERWLLVERAGPSVHPIMIVTLVFWLSAIFMSFGMNAPRHMTMHVVFVVLSLSIGSALFLIMEMDSPFSGLMQISGQPIEKALQSMLPAGR